MKKIIFTLLVITTCAMSQWNPNPAVNMPLSSTAGSQSKPVVISDNSGNMICAWIDTRNTAYTKIYVQKYNSSGTAQWQTGGVELSATQLYASDLMITGDGQGGAIICWKEPRGGSVEMYYARKINASGVPQWASEVAATAAYTASNNDTRCAITGDGAGGIILCYLRYNNSVSKYEVHTQHITSGGARNWGNNGVVIATSNLSVTFDKPGICNDQSGGAVIVYERGSFVYGQSVNSAGVKQWGAEGISIFGNTPGAKRNPQICVDGTGGAYIAVMDERNMAQNNFDLYAQKVTSAGTFPWGNAGKPVCTADGSQNFFKLESDKNRGFFIGWNDQRGDTYRPYVQKFDANASLVFALNGMLVHNEICGLTDIAVSDSLSVYTLLTTTTNYPEFTISIQKINTNGSFPWGLTPLNICSISSNKNFAEKNIIAADNSGAVSVWDELRSGPDAKAYGHKISSNGLTGIQITNEIPAAFELKQNYPNPFNPSTGISFSLPEPSRVKLTVYNSEGREVVTLVNGNIQAGSHKVDFNASSFSSGIYFYTLTAGENSQTRKMILIK